MLFSISKHFFPKIQGKIKLKKIKKREKEILHERRKGESTSKKKTNYELIPTPCRPTHTLTWINYPQPSHSPIIHNKNKMDIEFVVQMRQSNKCGSVGNHAIFNLHFGSGVGPSVSTPCLLKDISHIFWFHSHKELTKKSQRTQKWDSSVKKCYCTVLVYVKRPQG